MSRGPGWLGRRLLDPYTRFRSLMWIALAAAAAYAVFAAAYAVRGDRVGGALFATFALIFGLIALWCRYVANRFGRGEWM